MSTTTHPKRVLVIGAGVTGLVVLKEALAEGHDAVAFEERDTVGGQWAFQELDPSGKHHQSAVYNGIVFNSSRYSSCYGDFPIDPARYAEFLPHRKHFQYLQEYAEHFDLNRHIKFNRKVHACRQTETGGWLVEAGGDDPSLKSTLEFDAVVACTGHLSNPHIPGELADASIFRGRHLHSHYYKRPDPFVDARVAIVGLGNAALDIASELVSTARSVTLITRRGGWIIPRYVLGSPVEAFDSRFGQAFLGDRLSQWLQLRLLKFVAGDHPPELKPNHRILEQNPSINSDVLEKIRTGQVNVRRSGVGGWTETGLRLSDGSTLDADVVIVATGYDPEYTFLPHDVLDTSAGAAAGHARLREDGKADLYKLMVSPRYKNLFICGLIEQPGPQHQSSEAQARWVAAAISGRITLPAPADMMADINAFHEYQSKQFVHSSRHGITTMPMPYIDGLMRELGSDPTPARLWGAVSSGRNGSRWDAFLVLLSVIFAIPVACQWRLFGYGARPQLSTATILRVRNQGKSFSKGELRALEKSPAATGSDTEAANGR